MAIGETCGFKTTDEEIGVYVGLCDEGHWYESEDKYIIDGKRICGIYGSIPDLKKARKWNKSMKYFEKCNMTLHKIEDAEAK